MAIKEWVLTDHSCGLWVENLNLDENDIGIPNCRVNKRQLHGGLSEGVDIVEIKTSKVPDFFPEIAINTLKKDEMEDIINHFNKVGLPTKYKKNYDNKIFKIISSDKKNQNKKINLVLLKKIGKSYFERGLSISKIKKLIN